jgi:hypothetical protein
MYRPLEVCKSYVSNFQVTPQGELEYLNTNHVRILQTPVCRCKILRNGAVLPAQNIVNGRVQEVKYSPIPLKFNATGSFFAYPANGVFFLAGGALTGEPHIDKKSLQ